MRSQYCRLFSRFILSINRIPGSAVAKAASTIRCQSFFASTSAYTVSPLGCVSAHDASLATASMKPSVIKTDRLKFRSVPGSRLSSTNSTMSGWSQRKAPIMAPRRLLVASKVSQSESQILMKETGPEAIAPVFRATSPRGRKSEKSTPTPPPCCIVTAVSLSESRMPAIESSTGPETKQLNSVTCLSVPAPASTRPPGKNRKPHSSSRYRDDQDSGLFSTPAMAPATRANVSSRSASTGTSARE